MRGLLLGLICNCIRENQPEKVQFLKEMIKVEILDKDYESIKNFRVYFLEEFDSVTMLLSHEYEFTLEILKKFILNFEKSFLRGCFLRCLKFLYNLEGMKFKQFLKWAYLNQIDISLRKFAEYIFEKPMQKQNFMAIFMYIPVNFLHFSIYVRLKYFYFY